MSTTLSPPAPPLVSAGGNKRKLSVAIAIIGRPPLLFLDEPSTGAWVGGGGGGEVARSMPVRPP